MILIGAILLAVLVLPDGWGVPAIALGAAVEVAETAFWIRYSRRGTARLGRDAVIGTTAVVVDACRPIGRVRHQGETWRARCDAGADPGDRVRVAGIDGLTLWVEPMPGGR